MGTDFLCKVFKPAYLEKHKDWESKLFLRKMHPAPWVYVHMCVCFGSFTSNLGEV